MRLVRREIDAFKPDIVHAFLWRAIQFARWSKKGDFRLAASPRVNYRTRSPLIRWIDRRGRQLDDAVICESQSSADFLINSQGYAPEKVSVIRNGVDCAKWAFTPAERLAAREKLGLSENEILIFSAGRLDAQKGQEYLIKAAGILSRRAVKARLAVAGGGPLMGKLSRLACEVPGAALLGEQPDVRPWLFAADIFALPSLWEGIPNALLEAMSAGLACAASDVDGVREAAEDGKTALLVPPGDAPALASALERLCSDSELRNRLGSAAKKRMAGDFSVDAMISRYEAAYDALS